jgi:hypothetical protein
LAFLLYACHIFYECHILPYFFEGLSEVLKPLLKQIAGQLDQLVQLAQSGQVKLSHIFFENYYYLNKFNKKF